MIKGSLELVGDDVVAGWMFSPEINMKGRVVLAFQGEHCVGSGKIKTFREDLLSAGLGDGYLGFEFPITRAPTGTEAIIVRLEGSDLMLAQPELLSGSARPRQTKLVPEAMTDRLASLKWELSHGVISQSEFDFLRSIAQLGVFELSLLVKGTAEKSPTIGAAQPALENLFALLMRRYVTLSEEKLASAAKLRARAAEMAETDFPYFALMADKPLVITVTEGSHLVTGPLVQGLDRYTLQPQSVVFVDARTEISIPAEAFEKSAITLCRANPA